MRGRRSIRYHPRFPEAVPVRGAGCPRVTQPFATLYAPEGALTVRLACVRRAASVHPEPGSNSPSKLYWASSPSGPLSPSLIGSVRFIWFCLIGKGISRGRLSAALRKTNPSQTISNGSMSARMRHIWCVHPRSIRFSRCTPAPVPGSTGPRGKEIYCQTGGAPGAGITHSIFCSQIN